MPAFRVSPMAFNLGSLNPTQKALLAFQLRGRGGHYGPAAQTPKPIPRQGKLALSCAQERLWFLAQLTPEDVSYNVAGRVLLEGDLNIVALGQSLHAIVRRHEALRTRFVSKAGIPEQVIEPEGHVLFRVVDLTGVAARDVQGVWEREAQSESNRPFDLRCAPLLRCALLWLSSKVHILLLTMHHIVTDGWSMGVLGRELAIVYHALVHGSTPQLPPLTLQYVDFAAWSREQLQGENLNKILGYWKRQLHSLSPMDLPLDRNRQAKAAHGGAMISVIVDQELTQRLKHLGRQEGVTLFVVLLASVNVLLARYSGGDEITVGSPIANRTLPELEALIGLLANTIVLRTDVSGNPRFRQLLNRTGSVCLGAYEHQDLPFDVLVRELCPERDLSCNPLFQVSFALQNNPSVPTKLSDLSLKVLPRRSRHVRFDLEWQVAPVGKQLQVMLGYNTVLFEPSTATRMLEQYNNLLKEIVANPDERIRHFRLTGPRQECQPTTVPLCMEMA